MIAAPPVLTGAVNATLSDPLPRVATTPVGAPGGTMSAFSKVHSTCIPAGSVIVAVRVTAFPEPPVVHVRPAKRQPATLASVTV